LNPINKQTKVNGAQRGANKLVACWHLKHIFTHYPFNLIKEQIPQFAPVFSNFPRRQGNAVLAL